MISIPRVDFKAYQKDKNAPAISLQLELIVSRYGLYLKPSQAMECLGIRRDLMYGLLKAGIIKSKRIGGDRGEIRIAAADLAEYMQSSK